MRRKLNRDRSRFRNLQVDSPARELRALAWKSLEEWLLSKLQWKIAAWIREDFYSLMEAQLLIEKWRVAAGDIEAPPVLLD
jgi:hypothetical protein